MKILAVICNIILIGFTSVVLFTDGFPKNPVYVIFTLWSLLTLILSAVVIYYLGFSYGWSGLHTKGNLVEEKNQMRILSSTRITMKIVAIILNIVFIGFVCWAFIDQYPHPREDGFIAFAVLMAITPILNLVVFFLGKVNFKKPITQVE